MERRIEPAPHPNPTKGAHTAHSSAGHHRSTLVYVGLRERVDSSAQPLESARPSCRIDAGRVYSRPEERAPRRDVAVATNALLNESEISRRGGHLRIVVSVDSRVDQRPTL
ncbi:hypothetical protein C5E11_10900 [Clavibacter michiganensis]|nr:hypothetical protein C5E11_10900 [Clavibacter michiganensis]